MSHQLPREPIELRRIIACRRRPNATDGPHIPREDVVRVLMLCDYDLVRLAEAVNVAISEGEHFGQLRHRVLAAGIRAKVDDNVVRMFIRAVNAASRLARRGSGWASYHAKKLELAEKLGKSAYTHRRGPARDGAIELLDDDFDEATARRRARELGEHW